ncbi:NlpC/P60 family protein [Gordonia sp. SID5947]|uniref:C40 family peptidase n=1 Tax=Gordonia sp. SID5947 TaxID=2690315 RepID=UPI001370EC83|nr:C40 family peptidase [Gordonia sp. SID5947]MYR07576.1 NlpC/P60 family protein [Gordonia sp. SID5947]
MFPLALLLAPLQALLHSFGTGLMPVDGPSAQLRQTSEVLDHVRRQSVTATAALDHQWSGGAAERTVEVMEAMHLDTAHASDRGNDIATVMETASEIVNGGYRDLAAILESFVEITTAAGPSLLTPAGWPVLTQVAEQHLRRAVSVVERVRADVAGEARKLQRIAEQQSADQRRFSDRDKQLDRARQSLSGASPSSSGSAEDAAAQGITSESLPGGGVRLTLPNGKVVTAPNEKAANAVRAALTQQGVPYVWGGTSPGKGLDCSGLTQYSYRQAGVELPRTADQQAIGQRVPDGQAMAGDLVVWDGHVAMALGDGTLIEAGDPVAISGMRTDNIGMQYMGVYRPTAAGGAAAA